MYDDSSPQLVLFDGATGAGKTSLLTYLREAYTSRVFVGSKLTTRRRRITDNAWEMRFVERIPDEYLNDSFVSVGHQYAVDRNQLLTTISRHLVYAISCVDRWLIEDLCSHFHTVTIYVYRSWSAVEMEAFLAARAASDSTDTALRRDEIKSVMAHYLPRITLYNHVILNIGSMADLNEQLAQILQSYRIYGDGAGDQLRLVNG